MELARNLRVESVSRLEPTPPRFIDHEASVMDAVALMRQSKVGCVLVRDNNTVVGLFTERDLLTRVLGPGLPLHTPVSSVMTQPVVEVEAKDTIRAAIERLEEGGYRHLPVVDARKHIGILSARRIVHYLVDHFPQAVYNLPPDPGQYPDSAEGA